MDRFHDIKQLDTGIGSTIEDYIFLYGFISLMRPASIVEIGTNQGVSAIIMASAIKENNIAGHVHTYDINKHMIANAQKQINEMHLREFVTTYIGGSELVTGQYNIAFIDGGHTYKDVERDYDNLVEKSQWILIHDSQHLPEIRKFVTDILDKEKLIIESNFATVYSKGRLQRKQQFPGWTILKGDLYEYFRPDKD